MNSPSNDAGMDAGGLDPLSAHCEAVHQARCAWAKRCQVVSAQVDCGSAESDCALAQRLFVEEGAMRLDAARSAACVSAWNEKDCTGGEVYGPEACLDLYEGVAGEGQACGFCARGLTCSRLSSSSVCGTCAVDPSPPVGYPGEGEACDSPAVDGRGCAAGLSCAADGCRRNGGAGADCSQAGCETGFQCVSADAGYRCQPFPDLGQPCNELMGCKGGLRCEAGLCVVLTQNGSPCGASSECKSYRCQEGSCVAPYAAMGAPCSTDRYCLSAAWCAGGTCRPRVALGEGCSGNDCVLGSDCFDGVCRNRFLECQ
ncbi:MAG: hypothetical protein Q8N23_05980 [Archangium sp.]|nr:hypothetical protein [Archangium sp.]MDP3574920.1 hypothetical protein [Archangium sp.]